MYKIKNSHCTWVTREYAKEKFGFDLYEQIIKTGKSEGLINRKIETINLSVVKNIELYKPKLKANYD